MDESNILDVSFDQVIQKLKNPDLILDEKRVFCKFPALMNEHYLLNKFYALFK